MLKNTRGTSVVSLILGLALLHSSLFANVAGDLNTSEPGKYAEWEVVGPTGGDVRAVAIDPRDKDRLYISTLDGQIHTSSDGGRSWRLLVNLNQPE